MATKTQATPADFIEPLNMNGLEGRMLHMPAPKGKTAEIMFVYGHHSSLERWWGLMLVLNHYAAVTMPDLPGFGGMDSLYKIGQKPTIDNLADYLAAFVKMRYKHKRVVIAGMSFGFVIATRMLERHPDLVKKVDLLVSIVGFADHDDFIFSWLRYHTYLYMTRLFAHRLPAAFFRHVVLNEHLIRATYARTSNAKYKFADATTQDEFKYLMDIEVGLWHSNEVRTYMFTTGQFLKFSNCHAQVDLPVLHVSAKADHFFDNNRVEQHMRIIFNDFQNFEASLTTHAPSVIADEKMAAPLIPPKLRKVLAKL